MSICDDLAVRLTAEQNKLAADQQALSDANSKCNIDTADAILNDPNHPNPVDYSTVPGYLSSLPQGSPLIPYYQQLMIDYTNIGGTSAMISTDQANIAQTQQEQKDNNC